MQTINIPNADKVKDEVNNIEKQDNNVLDNVYEAVLQQAYYVYRLFHGTLAGAKDVDTLKTTLQTFYNVVSYSLLKLFVVALFYLFL